MPSSRASDGEMTACCARASAQSRAAAPAEGRRSVAVRRTPPSGPLDANATSPRSARAERRAARSARPLPPPASASKAAERASAVMNGASSATKLTSRARRRCRGAAGAAARSEATQRVPGGVRLSAAVARFSSSRSSTSASAFIKSGGVLPLSAHSTRRCRPRAHVSSAPRSAAATSTAVPLPEEAGDTASRRTSAALPSVVSISRQHARTVHSSAAGASSAGASSASGEARSASSAAAQASALTGVRKSCDALSSSARSRSSVRRSSEASRSVRYANTPSRLTCTARKRHGGRVTSEGPMRRDDARCDVPWLRSSARCRAHRVRRRIRAVAQPRARAVNREARRTR